MLNVDVIIPTHNCIFIEEAIKSVLNQSYQNINIIVVDDGSTDDTKNIVTHLRELNPDKIHYYYQSQQGPAAARNTGMKKSKGKYIAFLDADDIWQPDKIEKQLHVFDSNPEIGFVYCDNYFIDKNGDRINDYVRKIKLVEGNILLDFFMDFFLITSGIILKRTCLQTTGLFNETLDVGEDFEFFLRLAQNFDAGVMTQKLFLRRVWSESLSKQDYEKNLKTDIHTLNDFILQNPSFYQHNRKAIMYRISELRFKLGYMYLDHYEKTNAFYQFLLSIRTHPSIYALKGIIKCIIGNIILTNKYSEGKR